MLQFTVPTLMEAIPLSAFTRRHIGISLTQWRKIKQTGILLINDTACSVDTLVYSGDRVSISWIQECAIIPTALPLEICYEDEYMLIVDKPAGMLVHPTTKHEIGTVANGIMHYYQEKNLPFGFHPIHRLDRNTSGLVLIAKLPHIQHNLSETNIKAVKRLYIAVVAGTFDSLEGIIDAPIARCLDSIIKRRVHPEGKNAITYYRVLDTFKQASVLELELVTGRTHQIRVHLAHCGHAILGDDLYEGSTELINRQALHAAHLSFTHPVSGNPITVTSQLPSDMTNLLRNFTY